MINIVSSEFYKIFRSKIFYVISIILLGMNIISAVVPIYIQKSDSFSPEIKAQMSVTGIVSYQESYGADFIFYFILIFVVYLITSEYSNGSIRQMASHGISRWKLVLGQNIAISSVIIMILLVFGMLNLLSGTMVSQLGEVDIATFIRMNIGLICMFWGVVGIGMFLSHLFKNGVITTVIAMLFVMSGNVIGNLLTLLTKNNVFARYSFANMRRIIIDFTSRPEGVMKCSVLFLSIGAVTIFGSSLLFSKRDVD
ncbi:MAG TPA: ABC transporter permease [Epulopiscium sp.]|nr:ABC transporter permease [Candidatus Epulonipiscium sp.]